MGNAENDDFCQNSSYICNIFPINNKRIGKSLSLNIKNNSNKNTESIEQFSNQSEKESGKSIKINYSNIKLKSFHNHLNGSKFFLINPNSKNNINEIKKNGIKLLSRNEENIPKKGFIKSSSCIDINRNKILYIADLKHNYYYKNKINNKKNNNNNLKYKKNKEINKNFQKDINLCSEEEDTIINNTLTTNSNNSIQILQNSKEKKDVNIHNNNIEKENPNHNKNENEKNKDKKETNKIYEIEESYISSKEENKSSEKLIEIYDKLLTSNQSEEKKDKNSKNLIKDLKSINFKYSQKSVIRFNRKNYTIKESKRPQLIENENSKRKVDKKFSSISIPQIRHLDPSHPLNFLKIKRKIKSSSFPLNKSSFNIITYQEDNSVQYSYFENGIANGITKYIIGNNKKIIFEGEFEDGFPKGYGKYSIFNEGRFYEGIWDQEIVIGVETWKDGTVYMGQFNDNQKSGIGLYRWPDGTIYYGEWKNNNMDGFCYIQFADDRRFEGQMKNGRKNGYGEFTWKKTRKYIGNYVNDLKDGFGIYIWNIKTFQIYIGFWHKGKMEGIGVMILGDKMQFGKWYRGNKIERFKNKKELKLKYNSTQLKMATDLIRRRSLINIQNDLERLDSRSKNTINDTKNKNYHNEAKIQLEKCIDFMCEDFNLIKSFITNIFIKSNEFLKEK